MFVLLFAYVFGSAVPIDGLNYREFLMAGIFAQTVVFGSTITGASLAEDLQKGIIDRFRSLPMSRSAVLVGRTAADLANNVIVLVVMSLTGLVVGWRIHTSVLEALAGYALLLLFAYAMSWIMAVVGLLVRTPEVVNNASFIVIFPLTFIANTFVPQRDPAARAQDLRRVEPVSRHPGGPRAVRQRHPGTRHPTAWPLQNPELYVLIWVVVLLVVFVPLDRPSSTRGCRPLTVHDATMPPRRGRGGRASAYGVSRQLGERAPPTGCAG
jgi:ABC-type polysaccharide/polyol phosphate export permease